MPLSTDQLRKHFGARIRARREELRQSQSEIARKVGVQKETIYRIEKGLRGSSDDLRIAIAAALDVDPAELYTPPVAEEAS